MDIADTFQTRYHCRHQTENDFLGNLAIVHIVGDDAIEEVHLAHPMESFGKFTYPATQGKLTNFCYFTLKS